jgi:hypothetical protein
VFNSHRGSGPESVHLYFYSFEHDVNVNPEHESNWNVDGVVNSGHNQNVGDVREKEDAEKRGFDSAEIQHVGGV